MYFSVMNVTMNKNLNVCHTGNVVLFRFLLVCLQQKWKRYFFGVVVV